MSVIKSDYISLQEASDAWGVTRRYVNMCIAEGRIFGAMKVGNMWLIPKSAEKPISKRLKQSLEKSLQSELAYVVEATTKPLPRDNPDIMLDLIDEEWLRIYCEGALAYLRGDYETVIQCFYKINGDKVAAKLRYCQLAMAVAVSTGDYKLYLEIEAFCIGMIKADMGTDVAAVAEMALAAAYVGAFAPNMIPNWLKNGDFNAIPTSLRMEAICKYANYLRFQKKNESVLDVARTALAFDDPELGITYSSFYLRIMCAISCCDLDRMDDAEEYLLEAMKICLPNGFIVSFAESEPFFCGLLERLLKREYPEYYDAVIGLSKSIINNWITFHNRFTKDNITLILTSRDYQIARLASQGFNDMQIGKHLNLAAGTVKNRVDEICAKLFLTGRNRRKELGKFVI